jgi:(R,R)-butanediol dehydrogenase/meso-butanediol dehydrogenase/diacetyl reductase
MRAARYHGIGDVRIEECEPSAVGPGEVRIDVAAAGICGSDLHQYRHGPDGLGADEPHPLTGETLPVRLGHEFGGTVVEAGREVDLAAGQPVAVNPVRSCGACRYCTDGLYHLCETAGFIGLHGGEGGFAAEAVIPAANAVPFPADLPAAHSALVEPFAVAVHAVRGSGLRAGDSAAVVGAGPIGLALVQAARAAGAGEVLVSEPQRVRRDAAAQQGADAVFDPADDPVEGITAATDGGADVAFEASGSEAGLRQALGATRRRGETVVVGVFAAPAELQPTLLVAGERTVTGSLGYASGPNAGREFGMTIGMFERGRLDPGAVVTGRIGLEGLVERGIEPLAAGGSDHCKLLVEP